MQLVTVLAVLLVCKGFYLPGVAPIDYTEGEIVPIDVTKLDSVKTQLPYDYYALSFCEPKGGPLREPENLGEYLLGERIESSPYVVRMKNVTSCQIVCKKELTASETKNFATMIEQEYKINMMADSLPAFTKQKYEINGKLVDHYEKGFDLGSIVQGKGKEAEKVLHNHLTFKLGYHASIDKTPVTYRVVAFEVEVHSMKHAFTEWKETETKLSTCGTNVQLSLSGPSPTQVVFTYDVEWSQSDVKWASRWDIYLKMSDAQIHWFSIVNSLMIVIFLSGMVALIMARILRRDLARYNRIDNSEEAQQEETGWKLVHGDVFRPPPRGALLATFVGTGAQVFGMALTTMTFAVLGFLSPANRGGLMSAMLLLFVFMGIFAGYVGTRIYTMLNLPNWRQNTLMTALGFPGINFGIFFVLNLFVWAKGSSGAIPFFEMFALLVLWFGISVPLVYLGSYMAVSRPPIKQPVKLNLIPRLIPEQPWYMTPTFSILVGGVLPFGAVFIEVFFIMSSIWLHRFYYVFGFLFVVFLILIVTCIEITIVMCYFQLCSGDYRWWWRAYFTSGASALYLFLYSLLYFATKLDITNFLSGLLFFGYMSLISTFFFVLTGTIGFVSTLVFVRFIYASVKLE